MTPLYQPLVVQEQSPAHMVAAKPCSLPRVCKVEVPPPDCRLGDRFVAGGVVGTRPLLGFVPVVAR